MEVKEHVKLKQHFLKKRTDCNGFIFLSCDDGLFASEIYLNVGYMPL
jgi:hypothetical protein